MESDTPSPVLTREFIAKVIINRGRKVDLYEYLKTNPEELLRTSRLPSVSRWISLRMREYGFGSLID